jgi:threo-3-hydroxy-L-aspartate ammonia-lyase
VSTLIETAQTVTYSDIRDAQQQLRGHAHQTPVLTSRTLDHRCGVQVFLKGEHLQRIGAFKFRGAWNAISRLDSEQRRAGVVTFSSGNHAQAVALSCGLLGIRATVVMPGNAPEAKKDATRGYGATIVEYDPATGGREEIARRLVEDEGFTLIPPYDHPHVIAGAGTAALELFEQVGDLDALLVPCGGGGLLSGSAIAAHGESRSCRVVGVEPVVANDAALSFRTGTLHTVHNPPTLADGTRTASLGKLTFPLVLANVDDFAEVSEEAIKEAVRFAFTYLKQVIEPSGALGLAALLSGALTTHGRVGVIVSGGNIDAATMASILSESR